MSKRAGREGMGAEGPKPPAGPGDLSEEKPGPPPARKDEPKPTPPAGPGKFPERGDDPSAAPDAKLEEVARIPQRTSCARGWSASPEFPSLLDVVPTVLCPAVNHP